MAVHLSDVLNCWNAFATIIIKANCLNIQVRQFIIRIVNRGTSVRLSVWPNWPNFLTIILMGWYFFNCLNIGLTPIQEGRNHTCMYLSILIVNHNDFICYVYYQTLIINIYLMVYLTTSIYFYQKINHGYPSFTFSLYSFSIFGYFVILID